MGNGIMAVDPPTTQLRKSIMLVLPTAGNYNA
jgi:hypothetical protein